MPKFGAYPLLLVLVFGFVCGMVACEFVASSPRLVLSYNTPVQYINHETGAVQLHVCAADCFCNSSSSISYTRYKIKYSRPTSRQISIRHKQNNNNV